MSIPSSTEPTMPSTRVITSPVPAPERGQATAEYALVLLGAAAIAMLLVAWATQTGAVGRLLDAVLRSIIDKV